MTSMLRCDGRLCRVSVLAGLSLLPAIAGAQRPAARAVRPRAGLVITESVRLAPGTYRLPAPASPDSAAIVIRGDDITVEMTGVTLEGARPGAPPDAGSGVAIRIDGGHNVVIRRAAIHGYRVAILARGSRGLSLLENDLSHNWRPRLFSLVEHESLVDWLSFHHNDQDEWLRFGAAVYLADVHGGELRGNRAEHGMNGFMLVRSDSLRIWNNDISFNSGIGIGLYRSSDNTIMHNRVDYNVRGYSRGFFRRGQDSAALLLFEQSSRNLVAWNSMTHSGDGLFLWAGQSTMDTGAGGSNDNLFAANDFSFAPTNGMEATFSRNRFIGNRVEGSDHGLWGGYSFGSLIAGNEFKSNRIGIAVEHGQYDTVTANRFAGDSTAIRLWADSIEPSDWGYPRHRDTRSVDWTIAHNSFVGNRVGFRAARTAGVAFTGNRFGDVDSALVLRDTSGYRITLAGDPPDSAAMLPPELARLVPPRLAGGMSTASALARQERGAIIVTEWGPYDWRTPLLWPADSSRATPLALRVLGPAGTWRVVSRRGIAHLSADRGRMGDTISVTPAPGSGRDWSLTLDRGGTRFSWERFEPISEWRVRAFGWADSTDPRTHGDAFAALLRSAPILTRTEPRLDYMWYRPVIRDLPAEHYALEATATVTLPPGSYTLRTISEDGVRVSVDGVQVIDDWKAHESAVDTAPLAGGTHTIRVEYYQVDGWTELRVDIVRGADTSTGSPGPH